MRLKCLFSAILSSLLFALPLKAQSDDDLRRGAVVSVDKMNVLYIGVDNPVSVAVPGVSSEKVSAELSKNGTLKQVSPGHYVATVTQVDLRGDTEVLVYSNENGNKKLVGAVPFRVKRIPAPVAMIGPDKGGDVQTPKFKVQKGVQAVLENFDFDIRFNIVSYDMTFLFNGKSGITLSTNGALFSQAMLDVMRDNLCPGDKVILHNVKARGPDGIVRELQAVVYRLI